MEALLGLLLSKAGGYAAAALSAGAALIAIYFTGRSTGKADELARQAQATLDIVADEKAARESVEELSAAAAKAELSQWSR